ncbi:MAG: NAD-dependent epimerase/dehydratase family protein [Bryobacteraceae bacterium]|nr:NAD-dependent epimerase/dehydratase family protein [Bryobacteraceae bacterium]
MTALVTGATGFVGGGIVRALLQQGDRVRALARRTSKTQWLERAGVEISYGDILDQASIEAALGGCDALYHAAAVYEFWVQDERQLMRTEIDGTHNAMEAALRRGVGKVVYTSTGFTVGEPKGTVGNETTPHRGYFLSRYERAKYEAEQVVKSYIGKGAPAVILKPAGVIGAGDLKPTGQAIVGVLNGRFPAIFPGVMSFVNVDDVGRAHVLAAGKPAGEEYILSERTATTAEWMGQACRLAGARVPPVAPAFAVRIVLGMEEAIANLRRRPPMLPRETIAHVTHGFQVDGSKAIRELGIAYTPMEESLRQAIVWYWQQGLLKRKPACAD